MLPSGIKIWPLMSPEERRRNILAYPSSIPGTWPSGEGRIASQGRACSNGYGVTSAGSIVLTDMIEPMALFDICYLTN